MNNRFYEKELLEELREVQDSYGYIPEDEMIKISKKRDIPKSHLYGVITFYSMLYTEPKGKYIIRICNSVSCNINKSSEILKAVRDLIKCNPGETSENRKFSLEVVECLGHCGEGPVMLINGEVYDYLTVEKAVNIIKNL